jgi:hypothetical protein
MLIQSHHAHAGSAVAVCDTPLGARYLGYEYALVVVNARSVAQQEDIAALAEKRYLEVAHTTTGCIVVDETVNDIRYHGALEYEDECVYDIEGYCLSINVVSYRDWDTKAGFVFIDDDKAYLIRDILSASSKTLPGFDRAIREMTGVPEGEYAFSWVQELFSAFFVFFEGRTATDECKHIEVEERYFCISKNNCICAR